MQNTTVSNNTGLFKKIIAQLQVLEKKTPLPVTCLEKNTFFLPMQKPVYSIQKERKCRVLKGAG